jgi:hypothetical protein
MYASREASYHGPERNRRFRTSREWRNVQLKAPTSQNISWVQTKKKSRSRNSETHIASKMPIHKARAKQLEGAVYMSS